MGIRGLGGFIKWKLPHIRKSVRWADHKGEKWGVDCSCLLYRARGSGLSQITVIASLILRMRQAHITPVFIFDGRPPASKSDVVDQRRVVRQAAHKEMAEIQAELDSSSTDLTVNEKAEMERRHAVLQRKAPVVSSSDKDEVKSFLYACGVQFITASGEADDVLAYLCRAGTLQGVVSTDMDMLARGVPLLVIPETNDAAVLTAMRLDDVLSQLRLHYPQFVDACMLMGSDYSGREWRSIEPRQAVEIARKGVDWNSFDSQTSEIMMKGVGLLKGDGARWEEIVSEKQRAKWDLGAPLCEPDNLVAAVTTHGWPAAWVTMLAVSSPSSP